MRVSNPGPEADNSGADLGAVATAATVVSL
jgi:hypothetical protein